MKEDKDEFRTKDESGSNYSITDAMADGDGPRMNSEGEVHPANDSNSLSAHLPSIYRIACQ